MADLKDGESIEVQGSAAKPYVLKNVGGVYSCSCPAWRHQSLPIEQRTCKHLRGLRGDEAEKARVGEAGAARMVQPKATSSGASGAASSATAPPLLLAHRWEGTDVSGWWISEKLDGVRAYWDGEQFISRQGNRYVSPDWFVAGLPSFPLDGELWVDRQQFQRTVSIVRRQDKSDDWKEVTYVVFDAPAAKGPFEERLEAADRAFIESKPPHARVHPHQRCKGAEHLKDELRRVEALGGEGLMVRKPKSPYIAGRSATLLKVKTFKDAEGRVVKHLPGTGKHKGRLGALMLELPDGTRFSVGTGFSDAERDSPPAIGAVVTFRYQELTKAGVPRFPSFVRLRTDITSWPPASSDEPAFDAAPEKKAPTKKAAAKTPTKKAAAKTPTKKAAAKTPTERAPAKKAAAKATTQKAPAQKATAQESGSSKASAPRRLVFGSSKFWEVEQRGSKLYVRFGKPGSKGQTRLKTYDSAEEAAAAASKLVAQKLAKGYSEG